MTNSFWFFTSDGKINLGSKPSLLSSFVILTRTESEIEFQEKVTSFDLKLMGFSNEIELIQDFNHPSKIRIFVRKKYQQTKQL
jgi:hypothetical protein